MVHCEGWFYIHTYEFVSETPLKSTSSSLYKGQQETTHQWIMCKPFLWYWKFRHPKKLQILQWIQENHPEDNHTILYFQVSKLDEKLWDILNKCDNNLPESQSLCQTLYHLTPMPIIPSTPSIGSSALQVLHSKT